MKKALQIIGILLVIAVPAGIFGAYALWNKEHRDVASEKVAFEMTADELLNEFEKNEEAANEKYIDKAVLITGEYLETENDYGAVTLILKGAACSMADSTEISLEAGQQVTVKGRVTSYDDLFGDIRLDDCTIPNKNK